MAITPQGQPVRSPYVPTAPWEYALFFVTLDSHYWHREFETKAVLLTARMIGGAGPADTTPGLGFPF